MSFERNLKRVVLVLFTCGATVTAVAQQLKNMPPRRNEPLASRPAAPANRPAAAPAGNLATPARRPSSSAATQSNHVSLEIVAPANASWGTPVDYELIVRNQGSNAVENVRVEAELPRGMEFIAADPNADVESETATWTFDRLEAGRERAIKMQLKPVREGTLECHAMVTCMAISAVQTTVTRPQLEIAMTGPKEVVLGQPARFVLTISNPGTGAATNVVLRDLVPDGFEHPAGDEIEYEVGTLKPGDTRDVNLELIARAGGQHTNHAQVTADGGLKHSAEATIHVLKPELVLKKSGKKRRFLEQPITYAIEVSNPGDAKATRVTVQDEIPQGVVLVSAEDGGRVSTDKRSVRWTFDELPAGEARTVSVTVKPTQTGEIISQTTAAADGGLTATTESSTLVEGVTTLQLEVVDINDPIEVGGETTYEVRVVNRGTQAATNVVLQAVAPKGLKPTKAKSTANLKYEIAGQEVVFEPIPRLAARADASYLITVRAERAGSLKFAVSVFCDELDSSVSKEETTRVYADE
jgi:uncharacterized repeat protein (TIGR01451 family)